MSIFKNPFLSLVGQKERIANVGAVLNSAFNPFAKDKGVTANVSNKTVKGVLETVGSHPYISAGIVAGVATFPVATIKAVKSIIPKSFLGKVALGLTAPAIVTSVVSNPQSIVDTGHAIIDFETGSIKVASGQQTFGTGLTEYIKEHPIASGIVAVTGAVVVAKTAVPAVAGYLQTQATKENTQALLESKSLPTEVPTSVPTTAVLPTQLPPQNVPSAYPQDATNQASGIPTPLDLTTEKGVSRRKTRKKKSQEAPRQTISQRVNVLVNQNRVSKTYLNRIAVAQ
jgi:hypothetical protein